MQSLEILLDRFWVIKKEDRESYQAVHAEFREADRFAREYPGWPLILNERLARLEKIPSHALPFMGITEFTEKADYALFCALLIFLEDLEDGEAFLLSELVDRMEIQLKEAMEVDWTRFTLRKSLIRVMQFAEKRGLIALHEGNLDALSGDIHSEILYENTGLSRYMAVNYGRDTSRMRTADDYEKAGYQETDMDRGHFRVNRVYRSLLSSPAMYWETVEDPDSLYLKNQRQWVSKYLSENLGGRLDIHRNAAFYVRGEGEKGFGAVFPSETTLSDIILLTCREIRETAAEKVLSHEPDDTLLMPPDVFAEISRRCAEKYLPAWSKEYREMAEGKRLETVLDAMESWCLLKREEEGIRIFPGAFKFAGEYPKGGRRSWTKVPVRGFRPRRRLNSIRPAKCARTTFPALP